MQIIMLHLSLPSMGSESSQTSYLVLRQCNTVLNVKRINRCVSGPTSKLGIKSLPSPGKKT